MKQGLLHGLERLWLWDASNSLLPLRRRRPCPIVEVDGSDVEHYNTFSHSSCRWCTVGSYSHGCMHARTNGIPTSATLTKCKEISGFCPVWRHKIICLGVNRPSLRRLLSQIKQPQAQSYALHMHSLIKPGKWATYVIWHSCRALFHIQNEAGSNLDDVASRYVWVPVKLCSYAMQINVR